MNKKPNINLNELPNFSRWQKIFDNNNLTLMDYLYAIGTIDLAVAFSQLFWPEVVEVKGCYLRTEAFYKWHNPIPNEMNTKERQNLEKLINHLHIYDLFSQDNPDTPLEVDEYVGVIIRDCWQSSLKYKFPNIKFNVGYWSEPEEYGPTITFWRV